MNAQTVIAMVSLALALLSSVAGGLWYAFKVGALVTELSAAVARLSKLEASAEKLPVLMKDLEAHGYELAELKRRVSDMPPMREKLSSINEDVEELKSIRAAERLAVVERLTGSRSGMPAVREQMAPRPGQRKDDR